ncbi:TetR/AcrR family transcriptional regulator [Pseudoflavonifractor phocaeensis]|uniref:TetR/AcrR family transcriptional regulator n=1 Tax=Pseudoflavonifractor phocaeensis TaxID=1870988 RepID=UPI00195F21D5|nr:TetR/AcrR family transcriptional regulator [Pseudoflavonifractor phocaeensis]MBM6886322.1 TetR/AcrR family transcriptional regulator [Pseudoflavonifractor phocaeensis]
MSAKGLTKDLILAEAVACMESTGQPVVSLHEVARRLGVKTPSLYNHIKNTKELRYEIFQYAIGQFVANQRAATANKRKDEAVRAFAEAYHTFATENKGLYRLIMSIPSEEDDRAKEVAIPLLETVVEILTDYGLTEESVAHWQRVFRAILHGFISEEDLGYFYYYKSIDLKKSRDIAVQCFLDGLHAELGDKYRNSEE